MLHILPENKIFHLLRVEEERQQLHSASTRPPEKVWSPQAAFHSHLPLLTFLFLVEFPGFPKPILFSHSTFLPCKRKGLLYVVLPWKHPLPPQDVGLAMGAGWEGERREAEARELLRDPFLCGATCSREPRFFWIYLRSSELCARTRTQNLAHPHTDTEGKGTNLIPGNPMGVFPRLPACSPPAPLRPGLQGPIPVVLATPARSWQPFPGAALGSQSCWKASERGRQWGEELTSGIAVTVQGCGSTPVILCVHISRTDSTLVSSSSLWQPEPGLARGSRRLSVFFWHLWLHKAFGSQHIMQSQAGIDSICCVESQSLCRALHHLCKLSACCCVCTPSN